MIAGLDVDEVIRLCALEKLADRDTASSPGASSSACCSRSRS
jgi:hypothetical protein